MAGSVFTCSVQLGREQARRIVDGAIQQARGLNSRH